MRISRIITSIFTTSLLPILLFTNCSSDDDKNHADGGAGGENANAGSGGEQGGQAHSGGNGAAGDAVAGGGSGGDGGQSTTKPSTNTLDTLINTICAWEYRCCDSGEARFDLGPTINDVATCKEKFVYELHESNSEKGPFPPSFVSSLLNTLGYEVNLANVSENAKGIGQCITFFKDKPCNSPSNTTKPTHCTSPKYGTLEPCALNNLVKPSLVAGSTCDMRLAESATRNDIECVAGTSCIAPNTNDNLSNLAKCITRGRAGVLCDSDKSCDYGFYCNYTTGKCSEKGNPGDDCAYDDESAPNIDALKAPCKPGLTCNPATKTCVEDCKLGFICNDGKGSLGDDVACPTGASCLPVTFSNDSTHFTVCGTAGSTVERCNTAEDCGAGYFCNGSTCAPLGTQSTACSGTISGECGPGLYCKHETTANVCALYTPNGSPCIPNASTSNASAECSPETSPAGCIYNKDSLTAHVCSANLLTNGSQCQGNFECASARCEVGPNDTVTRCTAGTGLNSACDDDPSTTTLSCAEGLTCDSVSKTCIEQVGPGESCELNGEPNALICTNRSCNSTTWQDAGLVICSSSPVPISAGGTNVVCDGNHAI